MGGYMLHCAKTKRQSVFGSSARGLLNPVTPSKGCSQTLENKKTVFRRKAIFLKDSTTRFTYAHLENTETDAEHGIHFLLASLTKRQLKIVAAQMHV